MGLGMVIKIPLGFNFVIMHPGSALALDWGCWLIERRRNSVIESHNPSASSLNFSGIRGANTVKWLAIRAGLPAL